MLGRSGRAPRGAVDASRTIGGHDAARRPPRRGLGRVARGLRRVPGRGHAARGLRDGARRPRVRRRGPGRLARGLRRLGKGTGPLRAGRARARARRVDRQRLHGGGHGLEAPLLQPALARALQVGRGSHEARLQDRGLRPLPARGRGRRGRRRKVQRRRAAAAPVPEAPARPAQGRDGGPGALGRRRGGAAGPIGRRHGARDDVARAPAVGRRRRPGLGGGAPAAAGHGPLRRRAAGPVHDVRTGSRRSRAAQGLFQDARGAGRRRGRGLGGRPAAGGVEHPGPDRARRGVGGRAARGLGRGRRGGREAYVAARAPRGAGRRGRRRRERAGSRAGGGHAEGHGRAAHPGPGEGRGAGKGDRGGDGDGSGRRAAARAVGRQGLGRAADARRRPRPGRRRAAVPLLARVRGRGPGPGPRVRRRAGRRRGPERPERLRVVLRADGQRQDAHGLRAAGGDGGRRRRPGRAVLEGPGLGGLHRGAPVCRDLQRDRRGPVDGRAVRR